MTSTAGAAAATAPTAGEAAAVPLQQKVMYIHNLPHQQRRDLCRILDRNDKWEELGGVYMKYDVMTLQDIKREIIRGNSPTEELLTMWSHQNHTVLELFVLLSRMQHYQAMMTLKPFVDKKYHKLIYEGEQNLSHLVKQLKVRDKNAPCTKDLGIVEDNFDRKILNAPPTHNADRRDANVSCENNESGPTENGHLPMRHAPGTSGSSSIADVEMSAGAIPQIPYNELQAGTNDWNPNTMLGKGGFGTVFKGVWKCTEVAIKRIEQKGNSPESHAAQLRQSITELQCLNAYRHDNILPLYGYSISGPQPCLVYQYMPGGCLEQRLRGQEQHKPLSWTKRLNIAEGVARGLHFMHTIHSKPLIHGDIKSANVLLDTNDEPKIGDFGLARKGPDPNNSHLTVTTVQGTKPYLPDEFLRSRIFSVKVDTYSFGVVLFEIATGLGAYDRRQNRYLKEYVMSYKDDIGELCDVKAGADGKEYFLKIINVGKVCVSYRPKDRPEMVRVLMELRDIRKS